jgi:hypothetical protein
LGRVCKRRHISRAEAVRLAVAGFIEHEDVADDGSAFGLWRDREDGLAYEARLRAEWDR